MYHIQFMLIIINRVLNICMDGRKQFICLHMKNLTKLQCNALLKLNHLSSCQLCQNSLQCICLHCSTILCKYHRNIHHQTQAQQIRPQLKQQQAIHSLYLEIQPFSVYCSICKASIEQLLFEWSNPSTDPDASRMMRFQSYIRQQIWKILLKKFGIQKFTNQIALINLGNTCYLNVVLQALSASTSLYSLYSKLRFNKDQLILPATVQLLNKKRLHIYEQIIRQHQDNQWHIVSYNKRKRQSPKSKHNIELQSIKMNQLLVEFYEQTSDVYAPTNIFSYLAAINTNFDKGQQQDAEEVLLLILELLTAGQLYGLYKQSTVYNDAYHVYRKAQMLIGPQKFTPLQQLFSFYQVGHVQCNQCKHQNLKVDLSYHISLPIHITKSSNHNNHIQNNINNVYDNESNDLEFNIDGNLLLQGLSRPNCKPLTPELQQYFRPQQLSKDSNYYTCEKCHSISGIKKTYLFDLPQILIISYKRFQKAFTKIDEYLKFPFKVSLSGYVLLSERDNTQRWYQLYCVIVHEGSTINSGHYICYIRRGKQWFKCSDEQISYASPNQVKNQKAYVTLYEII